jgi:hypothetical protein
MPWKLLLQMRRHGPQQDLTQPLAAQACINGNVPDHRGLHPRAVHAVGPEDGGRHPDALPLRVQQPVDARWRRIGGGPVAPRQIRERLGSPAVGISQPQYLRFLPWKAGYQARKGSGVICRKLAHCLAPGIDPEVHSAV